MHQSYRVDTGKYIVSLLTCVAFVALAAVSIFIGRPLSALALMLLAAFFFCVAVAYGRTLTMDSESIRCAFWGIPMRSITWQEIAEVGIVGVKVFNNNNPKNTGRRYIYFSPEPLDNDSRFRLALEWPPRKMPYLLYSKERIDAIQMLWRRKIETYNAGDVFF